MSGLQISTCLLCDKHQEHTAKTQIPALRSQNNPFEAPNIIATHERNVRERVD